MIARLQRLVGILRWRGPGYLVYLVTGYFVPRLLRRLLSSPTGVRLAARWRPRPSPPRRRERAAGDDGFLQASTWLPEPTRQALDDALAKTVGETVVLGRIDNDGRILPLLGPIPDFDAVSEDEFVDRYRYGVDLVVEGGRVLIRKDYRGDRAGFQREWASLAALGGQCAPALHRVEPERLRLYKAFLAGPTLRDRLVADGAVILSVSTDADPEIQALSAERRLEAVWRRGQAHFACLGDGFADELERRLDAVHRRGVSGFSLTFGNVVLVGPEEVPCFLDFDGADVHGDPSGLRFDLARDRDRRLFARVYGRDLLTEATARESLGRIATPYSPLDLGGGLATPGFWSVDSGTGRWQLLNGEVLRPLIDGRRILDLGSFNALNPLLMLADGAREVVAVEKDSTIIPKAEELQRLFEWRDMTRYELDLRCADIRAILDADWGSFDLVTAFCSLYYLEADDMARVVRRAAELAPVMALQAKTDTRPSAGDDKAVKSSLDFTRRLLEENGFPNVESYAPRTFTRPLLIGRREGTPIEEASRG